MEFVPARAQGHLIVASIRVLSHQRKRPPTGDEIADLLSLSREIVLHMLRGLEARGIVRAIETPFEVRFDIEDHRAIDALPEDASGPDLGHEIEDFHKKTEDRQKKIERMMRDADPDRAAREKAAKIEEEFRRFRGRRPAASPFHEPENEKDES
jgi:DNA-binding transcriptional MocR family regulator